MYVKKRRVPAFIRRHSSLEESIRDTREGRNSFREGGSLQNAARWRYGGGGGGGGEGGGGKEPVSRAFEARASLYGRIRPTRSAIYIEGLPARANGTGNRDKTGQRRTDREKEREGERGSGNTSEKEREWRGEVECAQGGLSLSRGELRVNVRELGQSVPHLGEPEAMCRGSMLSVLERASPQPSFDTNGRFFFPRRKLAFRVSHDIVQANSYAWFAGEFGGSRRVHRFSRRFTDDVSVNRSNRTVTREIQQSFLDLSVSLASSLWSFHSC